ncbi:T9SS type A sorting domain-containing protein, partial [Candidatus Marinimicrobia bacterium]|nr:T9SS type A sorting domain-containing protein [Candidatus Neomarinimicrobiota bacterium]
LPSDMLSGTLEFLEINNDNELPISFSLNQNYPNPFNPTTNINYSIPSDNFVTVTVYNVMGEKIKTLSNGYATSGHKSVKWNAQNERGQEVSAGLYVYTIEAGDFRETKKMLLLK